MGDVVNARISSIKECRRRSCFYYLDVRYHVIGRYNKAYATKTASANWIQFTKHAYAPVWTDLGPVMLQNESIKESKHKQREAKSQ